MFVGSPPTKRAAMSRRCLSLISSVSIDCDITGFVGFGLDAGRFGQSPVQMNSILRLPARISPEPAGPTDDGCGPE